MVQREDLLAYLDETLQPSEFRDGCHNGLQVHGGEQVRKLATCPSVSLDFFSEAVEAMADTLLVHHGLFWDKESRVVFPHVGRRLQLLLSRGLNLIAYHLPLDAHRALGNNAQLADILELRDKSWDFGYFGGKPIGVCGNLPTPLPLEDLVVRLEKELACQPQVLDFTEGPVKRVGVLAGGGGDIPLALECRTAGCDLLLTGTMFEQTVSVARELRLSAIAAGHYNSEKLGVRALGDDLRDRFDIEVVHMDIPNPV